MKTFYEFFAGMGAVRLGLGEEWRCLFANDFDCVKADAYRANFGRAAFCESDIATLDAHHLPERADLGWASLPCQDFSPAGRRAGISGMRGAVVWEFCRLLQELRRGIRHPAIIAIENVSALVTSNGGEDLAEILRALSGAGYVYGVVIADAAWFVPQSRPRAFLVAAREDLSLPPWLIGDKPSPLWHPRQVCEFHDLLDPETARRWIWWRLPRPARRTVELVDLIETGVADAAWDTPERTRELIERLSARDREKLRRAQRRNKLAIGCLYERTRGPRDAGASVVELRTDDLAGCLRMPTGGASRQKILRIEGKDLRSRLLSAREAARLMGVPDDYRLPPAYSHAYALAADAVAVPVVRFLARRLIEPILVANGSEPAVRLSVHGRKIGRPRKHAARAMTAAERAAAHRDRQAALGLDRITVNAPRAAHAALHALADIVRWLHLGASAAERTRQEKAVERLVSLIDEAIEPLGLALNLQRLPRAADQASRQRPTSGKARPPSQAPAAGQGGRAPPS